ncbi:hypothetical protein [Flavobacterium selenitireducens]|uniref:hypothetical protein n=1 Tax=Flavobacterium selenitireducens TaxID=2722704 RepID=UPI00168A854F|nr:hypothetical protein [Flavobacterium selenitireducens]MBD3581157.1 hypothetical protein [Flavobacterium selenitireducens]
MKRFPIMAALFFVALSVSCKRSEPESIVHAIPTDTTNVPIERPAPNTSVIAGKSIGNIELEMDAQRLESLLGAPDLSDSAMGKSWMTWYSDNSEAVSGKYELNVFTAYKDDAMDERVVRLVRVTSPEFTVDSIGTGKKMSDVTSKFPAIANVGDYTFGKTKGFVSLYDDQDGGVAFEFLNDSCIGIIIHPRGQDVTLDYRTFRPDMTLK